MNYLPYHNSLTIIYSIYYHAQRSVPLMGSFSPLSLV